MNNSTDFELIQLYIKGNVRAFEVLYARHRGKLYYFINQLMNNSKGDVDDIFQAVWVKVIDKMQTLKDEGSFYGYLQQTARNMVIDRARKLKRQGMHIAIDDEESLQFADMNTPEPYFDLLDVEERELLQKALATLSDEQRRVWELRMQNYSFKDIAAHEKCSINTALARMSYAKKNIKMFLQTHI